MGQYFDTSQRNYGDGGASAYANAANQISGAIGQYSQQQAAEKELKMKAAIADQQRQDELEKQITMDAAQYGVAPTVGKDGKTDIYATAAAATKAKAMFNRVQASLGLKDQLDARQSFDTGIAAKERGLPLPSATSSAPAPTMQQPPAMGMDAPYGDTSPATSAATVPDAIPIERQIYLADEAKKKADYERQKKEASDIAIAQAGALSGQREADDFRKTFQRDPSPAELDATGKLNAQALGALQTAKENQVKGFMTDPSKAGGLMPIPGGPADIKMQADKDKLKQGQDAAAARDQQLIQSQSMVLDNIDKALPQVGATTAGVLGGRLGGIYQPAHDLGANLDAIKAGMGVETINAMRASSGTGSTGIGRIMQVEFDAFSKAVSNIGDQKQSPDQLKQNLLSLKTHLQNWQAAKQLAAAGHDVDPVQAVTPSAQPAAQSQPFQVLSVKRVK